MNNSIRPEIADFAQRMEFVLQNHDSKSPWQDSTQNFLEHMVRTKHFDKLKYAVCGNDHAEVIKQATHISNYCMMICSNAVNLQTRSKSDE